MQALLKAISQIEVSSDAERVFHGRGGLHPGSESWTLDFYPPVWVLTCFDVATEEQLATLHEALAQRWQQLMGADRPLHLVYQERCSRQADTRLLSGEVPEPHVVTEHDMHYRVHVLKGQNHGLFLDMAEGRRWVQQHMAAHPGGKVLNLFAYTCAFSVVALRAGAGHVTNVDMSRGALGIGQQNHRLNGLQKGASFMAHDIFNSWGKITRSGPYDLIIADPPSYQKGSFVAGKDYARLMRRLPQLLQPGAHALICLNAPELGVDFLQDQMKVLAPELEFVQRVANPAAFADVSDARSLKVLVYRNAG